MMYSLHFERSHLAQPANVPLASAELGGEESVDKIAGHSRSHDPAANTKYVHIVMLDSLVSRIVVLNQPGPHSGNFVRTD